jgi:hypothetical protein
MDHIYTNLDSIRGKHANCTIIGDIESIIYCIIGKQYNRFIIVYIKIQKWYNEQLQINTIQVDLDWYYEKKVLTVMYNYANRPLLSREESLDPINHINPAPDFPYLSQARTWTSIDIWFGQVCSYWNMNCLSFPEHLIWSPVVSGVLVTSSLIMCVCFVDRCLSFCPFSFDYCVICSS